MSQDMETVKKLYEQSKSFTSIPAPKQGFTGAKCPRCGSKLKKEAVKQPLYVDDSATEFAKAVAVDFKSPNGLYSLAIESFKCTCGYEYMGRKLDRVEI